MHQCIDPRSKISSTAQGITCTRNCGILDLNTLPEPHSAVYGLGYSYSENQVKITQNIFWMIKLLENLYGVEFLSQVHYSCACYISPAFEVSIAPREHRFQSCANVNICPHSYSSHSCRTPLFRLLWSGVDISPGSPWHKGIRRLPLVNNLFPLLDSLSRFPLQF